MVFFLAFILFVCLLIYLEEDNVSFCGHNLTCHQNATCTPSQECVCDDEFIGNGTSCQSNDGKKTTSHQTIQNESDLGVISRKQIFNPGAFFFILVSYPFKLY